MRTVWASEFDDRALNRLFGEWAAARIFKDGRRFAEYCTMGVMDGDRTVAVMVYHNHDPQAGVIEISGAADTKAWLKRHVLREMFGVPFDRMGCQMVCMRVSPDNGDGPRGLQRLLKAFGFNALRLPRMRGRGEDELLFTLTDDAWKANGFN